MGRGERARKLMDIELTSLCILTIISQLLMIKMTHLYFKKKKLKCYKSIDFCKFFAKTTVS